MRATIVSPGARRSSLAILIAALSACGPFAPTDEPGPLVIDATAELAGDSVRYTMIVTNRTDADMRIVARECRRFHALVARGVDGPGDWHERAWTQALGGCWPMYTYRPMLAHETAEFPSSAPVTQILGDSLPDGRYALFVATDFAEPEMQMIEIPVGEFELRR